MRQNIPCKHNPAQAFYPKGVNTKEPYHYPAMEHDKALFVAVEFQTINSPPLKSEF